MEEVAALHLVESCDGVPLLIVTGITARDEHHTHRRTGVELDAALAEVALGHALEEVYDVALETEHHALSLGVAHAHVVLDDHRLALHVDKAKEDEALVVDTLGSQALDGGAHDALLHLLHPCCVGKGYGRDGAHTTRVESCVALADTLVVLGFGEQLIVLTVGEHEHGALNAREELLDDHAGRCRTEHAAQHLAQLPLGLLDGVEDEHTLTGTEAIGLEHIGCLKGVEEGDALVQRLLREGLVARGRDTVTHHEGLGKVLAALQRGTSPRGTYHGDTPQLFIIAEIVVDTLYQRILGTYHHHVDVVGEHESLDALEVGSRERYIFTHLARTGITRSDIQFLHSRTLAYLPSQGMLTSATAQQ